MAKISTITFNGSNAYELSTGEFATSWPYGAVGFEQASAGVQLYSATAGSGAILRIRAIGANGLLVSEQNQTHMLTVLNLWERAEKTYTIPAGTVKLELRIVAVGGTVLFAQPKLANGASVGAYATNFAPQLTMITPTGIYTGTITAEQIILTGGERLPDRLLTLNASLISLQGGINSTNQTVATLSSETLTFKNTMTGKTSKLDADGLYISTINADQIKGGVIRAASPVTFGPFTQADHSRVRDSLFGVITLSEAERRKYDVNMDGQVSNTDAIMISRMLSGEEPNPWTRIPTVRIEPPSGSFEGGIFFGVGDDVGPTTSGFYMSRGKFTGREFDVFEGKLSTLTAFQIISDRNGGSLMLSAGELLARSPNGTNNLHLTNSKAQVNGPWSTNGENAWGVDSGGPYFIKNGTKTYL